MRSILVFLLATSLFIVSCDKDKKFSDDDLRSLSAKKKLLISKEYYNTFPNDHLMISSASISGDTLTVTLTASCCGGSTWIINLVGKEEVLYSDPPQREIRLSLKNDELCDALCGKQVKFDITPTKLIDTNRIILYLSGWDAQLIYNY